MPGRMWECPNEKHPPVRAPEKMRARDPRRFCLECSKGSKLMVERVCSTLERRRERRAEAQQGKKRARTLAKARIRSTVVDAKRLHGWKALYGKAVALFVERAKLRVTFGVKRQPGTAAKPDSRVLNIPEGQGEATARVRVLYALYLVAEGRAAGRGAAHWSGDEGQGRLLALAAELFPEVAVARSQVALAARLGGRGVDVAIVAALRLAWGPWAMDSVEEVPTP